MHPLLRRFQDRAHESDGGAFAVGAGDMDYGRQPPLRTAERRQYALDAIERQIDPLRMQRQQPRKDLADCGGVRTRRVHPGAGRLMRGLAGAAGAFSRSRHSRAMVDRRSWRCTTMSTMPWAQQVSDL